MSLRPEVLDALLAAGATAEMIVAAVKADACGEEIKAQAKREGNAERQRRFKAARKAGNADNALPSVTERDRVTPPNEYISNPPEPSEAEASLPPLLEKVVSEWNLGPAANGARKATKLDASRKALLRARLRDHGEVELFAAMANLGASKFHCGENDRGWRANLGWFLEAKNFLKALEMGEGDRKASSPVDMDQYRATMERLAARGLPETQPSIPSPAPRTGNTGPPRAIGDLIQLNR